MTMDEQRGDEQHNIYKICPECLGHGEVIAYVPLHPEDMPDYFVPCPNDDCENGLIKRQNDSNDTVPPTE